MDNTYGDRGAGDTDREVDGLEDNAQETQETTEKGGRGRSGVLSALATHQVTSVALSVTVGGGRCGSRKNSQRGDGEGLQVVEHV